MERITAWQSIGCGCVEAPQPCVGVCADRRIELANAADLDAARAELELARDSVRQLAAVARQIAHTTPRALWTEAPAKADGPGQSCPA
jgi:hypothetical protein